MHFQFRPQLFDQQYAKGPGEQAEGTEELQAHDDGHEETDREQSQSAAQQPRFQKLTGQPGDSQKNRQPEGHGKIPLKDLDHDPGHEDDAGAEDRQGIDQSGQYRPEPKERDMQEENVGWKKLFIYWDVVRS